jgi:LysR family transcriptional regulator, hydrogen peroxide-inducible genes activator
MEVGNLTLKDLEYALAVAEHLNFSVAAQASHISQPALSKQIKVLEIQLGVVLFERNKRQVRLTQAGEVFCLQARRVLDEAGKLIQAISPLQKPLTGRFNLGIIASTCPYLMPYCVSALQEQFPSLQLFLTEGLTDPLLKQMRQGQLDAVIAANTFDLDGFEERSLYFEPFVLAVSREANPKQPSTIHVQDIQVEKLLLLEDGHCLKDQTTELCMIPESRTAQQFKATSLETLLHMTAGGIGISIIPAMAVPEESPLASRLLFSQLAESGSGRIMSLYSRSEYPIPANLDALAVLIRSCVPSSVQIKTK